MHQLSLCLQLTRVIKFKTILSGLLSIRIHKIVCIHNPPLSYFWFQFIWLVLSFLELKSTGFFSLTISYDDPSPPIKMSKISRRNSFKISESASHNRFSSGSQFRRRILLTLNIIYNAVKPLKMARPNRSERKEYYTCSLEKNLSTVFVSKTK